MGKKMKKFPLLSETAAATWRRWPACTNTPQTLSFRDNIEKTSTTEISSEDDDVVFKGLRSERLFFEPGKTNSILEEAKSAHKRRGVEMLIIETKDPVFEFRVSMEEMVEANGLKDLGSFSKLLGYYLKVNEQENYAYIFEAFLGLLNDHFFSGDDELFGATTTRCSFTSSSSASLRLSNEDEIVVEKSV